MYLPLLLISPVQYAVTQQGSLLLCERCTGLAAFGRSGGNLCPSCVAPLGHHWLWWCTSPPVFLRLLGSSSSPSSSRPRFLPPDPAHTSATCTGAVTTTCTACGLLLDCFGPIRQLRTFVIRGVFVPIDFRHGNLLPMLFLEIGNEFPHLVGTPTSSLQKPFCRARVKPWLMKKVAKVQ